MVMSGGVGEAHPVQPDPAPQIIPLSLRLTAPLCLYRYCPGTLRRRIPIQGIKDLSIHVVR